MNTIHKMFFLFLFSFSVWAGDVYVIANSGVNLPKDDIISVFNGDKQIAGGVKLTPVDNKAAQANFLSAVMKMDKMKYESMWGKKSFVDGIPAPKVKGSDADVIDFIKNTPGGIGYVSSPGDSKVIGKF